MSGQGYRTGERKRGGKGEKREKKNHHLFTTPAVDGGRKEARK